MRRRKPCFIMFYLLVLAFCFNDATGSLKRDTVRDISQQLQERFKFGWGLTGGSVINSFIDVSVADCIWECGSRPGCHAFEYRTAVKYCRLLKGSIGGEKRAGFVSMTGFETLSSPLQCGTETCSPVQACQWSTASGHYTCHNQECGHPGGAAFLLGNRYEEGSRLLQHHEDGLRQVTCGAGGEWQYGEVFPYPGVTCEDIRKYRGDDVTSGVYLNNRGVKIYCEFDGGDSWLVFQRRKDGSVDFYQNWNAYKCGFGDLTGEFWLGLQKLYGIVHSPGGTFTLRIDLEDWGGETKNITYGRFSIKGENDKYRLDISHFKDTDNNSFVVSQDLQFSTIDNDNDKWTGNCAEQFKGGWWYNSCAYAVLNGKYFRHWETHPPGEGLVWQPWRSDTYSLKASKMKIKRNH